MRVGSEVLAERADKGTLPQLRAATVTDAESGQCSGPDDFQGLRGVPTLVRAVSEAREPR